MEDKEYKPIFRNRDLIEFPGGSVRSVTGNPDYFPHFYIPKSKESKIEKEVKKS